MLSEHYIFEVKDYFASLGYTDKWCEYVAYNPETKISYKTLLPAEFMIKNGTNDNVKAYCYLCRFYDWTEEQWNPLPELPLELIPKLIPGKLIKAA